MSLVLDGQHIEAIKTIKSMYDNDCVVVIDSGGNEYRLPVTTVIQMVNQYQFIVEKKRVHQYLVKACKKD